MDRASVFGTEGWEFESLRACFFRVLTGGSSKPFLLVFGGFPRLTRFARLRRFLKILLKPLFLSVLASKTAAVRADGRISFVYLRLKKSPRIRVCMRLDADLRTTRTIGRENIKRRVISSI